MAGAGTQTAGLGFGGLPSPGIANSSNSTEEYDGTAWTGGGTLGRKINFEWSRNSNSSFISSWRDKPPTAIHLQVKNIMEQVGQQEDLYQQQNIIMHQLVFKLLL
jgi:hypothetical protein